MAFRKVSDKPLLPAGKMAELVAAAAAAGVDMAAGVFQFSRSSGLKNIFPPSARGGPLQISTLNPVVHLTHPAIAPGENGAEFRNFVFAGAAGANQVDLSETPAGLIQYYHFVTMQHDDAVNAQRMAFVLQDNRSGVGVIFMDTAQMTQRFPTGVVSSGVTAYYDRGLIVVPPGCFLRAASVSPGIGAGNVITIRGTVRVQPLAETPPPMF